MQKWSKVENPDNENPHIWIHFTFNGPQISHKNLQRYEIQNNNSCIQVSPKLLKQNSKKNVITSRLYEFACLQCKKLYIVKIYKFRGQK